MAKELHPGQLLELDYCVRGAQFSCVLPVGTLLCLKPIFHESWDRESTGDFCVVIATTTDYYCTNYCRLVFVGNGLQANWSEDEILASFDVVETEAP